MVGSLNMEQKIKRLTAPVDKLRALAGNEPNALRLNTVATLFRNFHVWLYGSQTSNYFNIHFSNPEMMLSKYINMEDVGVL